MSNEQEEQKLTAFLEMDMLKMVRFINEVGKLVDEMDMEAGEMIMAFAIMTGRHFEWGGEEDEQTEDGEE